MPGIAVIPQGTAVPTMSGREDLSDLETVCLPTCKKVKVALEQAMKAQMECRGLALHFL